MGFRKGQAMGATTQVPSTTFLCVIRVGLCRVLLSTGLRMENSISTRNVMTMDPSTDLLTVRTRRELARHAVGCRSNALMTLQRLGVRLVRTLSGPERDSETSQLLNLLLFTVLLSDRRLRIPFLVREAHSDPIIERNCLEPQFTVTKRVPQ